MELNKTTEKIIGLRMICLLLAVVGVLLYICLQVTANEKNALLAEKQKNQQAEQWKEKLRWNGVGPFLQGKTMLVDERVDPAFTEMFEAFGAKPVKGDSAYLVIDLREWSQYKDEPAQKYVFVNFGESYSLPIRASLKGDELRRELAWAASVVAHEVANDFTRSVLRRSEDTGEILTKEQELQEYLVFSR